MITYIFLCTIALAVFHAFYYIKGRVIYEVLYRYLTITLSHILIMDDWNIRILISQVGLFILVYDVIRNVMLSREPFNVPRAYNLPILTVSDRPIGFLLFKLLLIILPLSL